MIVVYHFNINNLAENLKRKFEWPQNGTCYKNLLIGDVDFNKICSNIPISNIK